MSLEAMRMVEKAESDARKMIADAKAEAKAAADNAAKSGRERMDAEAEKARKAAEDILEMGEKAVKSTQAASSDMRFYAIITSKDSEGKVSNYAINLGTLEFSGKSLKRILNEEGKSILEDYIQAEK